MNSLSPQRLEKKEIHLKIVKNNLPSKKTQSKIYINTLTPNFSYINHLGANVFNTQNCIFL